MPTGGDHTKYEPKLRETPLPTEAELKVIRLEGEVRAYQRRLDEEGKRAADAEAERDEIKLQVGALEAALKEEMKISESRRVISENAQERAYNMDRLNEVLQKFYDWYQNAGSWSNVSFNPEDGCRWILKPDEHLEGERLSDAIDALLSKTEKRQILGQKNGGEDAEK